MENLLFELALILVIAAASGLIFRLLHLPLILGYILTGLLLGPIGLLHLSNEESFEALAKIGITLLLFILGLELKIGELKAVGKVAVITGIGQIVFTSIFGFALSYLLGFDSIESMYLAIALTFSSTIVIVKLLSDKKDLNSLYGKISIGFLLIQDFVAIIALILLTGLSNSVDSSAPGIEILIVVAKAFILFMIVMFISNNVIPYIVRHISSSQEMLFLFSIAWAFGVAALVSSEFIGLSIEIGGFLAGLALANAVESVQIVSKVKSLRDFFLIIFFVALGMSLDFNNVEEVIIPATLLSIFVLIGNPLIVMMILGTLGYRKRTGFLCGLTVAQISEFSLIVIFLGKGIGHVSDEAVSVITFVTIVTFTVSSYLILQGERIYTKISPLLSIFEKSITKEDGFSAKSVHKVENHIIIVGAHRMGQEIINSLEYKKDKLLIVDFDPSIVKSYKEAEFNVLFGDFSDIDIQEESGLETAKIIISTLPSYEDTMILIRSVRKQNEKIKIIVTAEQNAYVKDYYENGADFVIQPYSFIGKSIGEIVKDSTASKLVTTLRRKTQL